MHYLNTGLNYDSLKPNALHILLSKSVYHVTKIHVISLLHKPLDSSECDVLSSTNRSLHSLVHHYSHRFNEVNEALLTLVVQVQSKSWQVYPQAGHVHLLHLSHSKPQKYTNKVVLRRSPAVILKTSISRVLESCKCSILEWVHLCILGVGEYKQERSGAGWSKLPCHNKLETQYWHCSGWKTKM